MIRTNLATRPFYNERAVQLGLLVVALLAALATAFNVSRLVQLSRRDTRLSTQAARDESGATDLRRRAARVRASIDPRLIERAAADARQANELIDRRTFSWTELFNRFETTLPDEVRFTTVRPKLDPKRGIVLTIIVAAQNSNVDAVNLFIDHLESTGAFTELQKIGETVDDENQLVATIESVYTPSAARPSDGAER